MLPFPAMSEPVLLKEFFSLDGEAKPAVSFTSLLSFENDHLEGPTQQLSGIPQ